MIGPTGVPTGSALSSASAFFNRIRQASVCGPRPTQPLQPGVPPCLATTLVVKNTHVDVQMGLAPVASQSSLSSFPPCHSKEVLVPSFSLITNLSSGGTRCNGLALWTPFSVRMMCSSHWRLANPDSMTQSLIQIACWHGCVFVHHSFSEWQHLARVRFPKNTHERSSPFVFHLKSRQAPCCMTNQPR